MKRKERRVIAAGMIRSGSTYQFNMLRIIMEKAGWNPVCYWVNDYKYVPGQTALIKTHEFKPGLVEGSTIFTAIRSEIEIKGSMRRRAEYLRENPDTRFSGTADPKRYPRYFGWFRQWRDCAHYTQHYYQIKDAPILAINNHIKVLGLTGIVTPEEVLEELNNVKPPANGWDASTFLHAGHITKE